jgi:poly(3-hydroxybutyrate) depolymerase
VRLAAAVLLLAWSLHTRAGEPRTFEYRATLASLFPAGEAAALARTLPADREVVFRVRLPSGANSNGALVFVSPGDSGELPPGWESVLDTHQLAWIAADGYGNRQLAAERVLVALMGARYAQQLRPASQRIYVAGFSGGGRVASRCIVLFARYFDGAVFMGGVDFVEPQDERARTLAQSRRLVFITGDGDFNRRETKSVLSRYRKAGFANTLLLDMPGLGHEPARPEHLDRALVFLEAR